MDKQTVLSLNVIPEGRPPWLGYQAFRRLQNLFDAIELPAPDAPDLGDAGYCALHTFLTENAGLTVPAVQAAVHVNAFLLIRRGYCLEEITPVEYARLTRLLAGTEQADLDDLELHEFGSHRSLHQFLTEELGLYVEPGRGPVWQRADRLVKNYEAAQTTEAVLAA